MNKIQKIGVISLLLAIASIGFITADSEYNVVISPENPTVDNGYNVVISPENPTVFNAINVTAQLGFENANESATINIVDPYGNSTIINAATNENGEFIISFIPEYVGNYNITTTVGNWSQTQEITVSDRPNISLNLINFADPVKGDNINVVAEANDTVYPGDYVNFTVTDPNGIVSSQSVTFDGNVASFDISNATTGNYSVSAVAYDSDDEPISDVANKIIYVADTPQRSYDLTLSYAPESPLNGDDVIVTAKANDTVNPGDHVFFTVTDPNGNTNNQSVTFEDATFNDSGVASFSISNATTGNYNVSAVAYDSDDESISDVANTIIYVADIPQRSYDLTLSYAPESPLNGDDVIVTAKANDTVNPGDHVFFTVTDPNGNTNGQSVTFEDVAFDGDVASFSISNVTTGNYIVSAIVYDSDNESITEVVNTTISVADRSYSLKLSISNSPQLYGVAHLIAEANDTVNFGDYVIFKVTDPNGIVSSYTAPFDGNIASYDIQINPNGRYYFEAFAYNKNGEAILS